MKKNFSPIILLPIISITCVVILILVSAVFTISNRVETIYGQPTRAIGAGDYIRLSITLLSNQDVLTVSGSKNSPQVPFSIQPGETPSAVAARLQENQLIPNADAWIAYLIYAGLDSHLKSGDYLLSAAQTPIEIAKTMQDIQATTISFTVFAGWRLEEIAAALPTSGLKILPEDFIAAAHVRPLGYSFTSDMPPTPNLEGFLFPGTYDLARTTTAQELVAILLQSFDQNVTPELRQAIQSQGLTLLQGVTLASIVQREMIVEEEMPRIASVYLNRIAQNMKLEADPTVQYAIGYNQSQNLWWSNPLSLDDLKFDSPYNTYQYGGLPPAPIANPSLAALQAVAFPEKTPYLFFRAACDGSGKHNFAATYQEHLNNACP